ncbi:MAG: hypothetical protein MUP64_04020 [Anaerolineae bacterium]|nr:hypothetical protein [Anaerolineae bacterium]
MSEVAENTQEWFWSEEWQAAEREVDADLEAGRVHTFQSADEAIRFLRRYSGEDSGLWRGQVPEES